MSAEVAWAAVRKSASYTVKRAAGQTFSRRSVTGFHRTSASQFGRRRAVDVTPTGKPALVKIVDGKTTVHRYSKKRALNLLAGVRGDQIANVNKKVRRLAIVRARTAGGYTTKKAKNVKA